MAFAEEKIKSRKEVAEISARLKSEGKIVVTTNGSFDLFHSGHVFLLEEAKKQGDVLIVGVNADSSVRAYKGKGRPIIPEKERALLVAAIYCVDFVCLFEEPTCLGWLEEVKPNVHVKDENWAKNGELIESRTVRRNGGKVVLIKRKQGFSTTNIIEKILKEYCKK